MADTAVPTIGEIIGNLGGTPTAKTVVPALEELKALLGEGGIADAVDAWLEAHPEAITVQDGSISFVKLASDAHYMTTDEILALYE